MSKSGLIRALLVAAIFLCPSLSLAALGHSLTGEANLISNPSFTDGATGTPTSWLKGRWGSNTATFTYPVAGSDATPGAQVTLSNYVTGDAKWYFNDVPVTAGDTYEFSNFFKSSTKTYVTIQFTHSNGATSYLDLGAPAAAGAWTEFKMPFTVPTGVTSLTIFHVLKGVGTLTVDDFKLKPTGSDPTKFDQGYVSLNFDDGWLSVYQNAIPILNAKNFKSDQFITTDYLTDNYPGYVKPDQVLAMQAQGHIIGNHTKSHPDLTALTLAQAQAEIEGAKNNLVALGVPSTNMSLAYPLGAYNNSIKQLVQNAGHIAGRSSDGGFNDKLTDHYALRRQPMLNTTTFTQVKNYIDTARADKTWVILLFHEIDNSGHQYSITPALFQQIVNYLDQINITPITVKEGIAKMNP